MYDDAPWCPAVGGGGAALAAFPEEPNPDSAPLKGRGRRVHLGDEERLDSDQSTGFMKKIRGEDEQSQYSMSMLPTASAASAASLKSFDTKYSGCAGHEEDEDEHCEPVLQSIEEDAGETPASRCSFVSHTMTAKLSNSLTCQKSSSLTSSNGMPILGRSGSHASDGSMSSSVMKAAKSATSAFGMVLKAAIWGGEAVPPSIHAMQAETSMGIEEANEDAVLGEESGGLRWEELEDFFPRGAFLDDDAQSEGNAECWTLNEPFTAMGKVDSPEEFEELFEQHLDRVGEAACVAIRRRDIGDESACWKEAWSNDDLALHVADASATRIPTSSSSSKVILPRPQRWSPAPRTNSNEDPKKRLHRSTTMPVSVSKAQVLARAARTRTQPARVLTISPPHDDDTAPTTFGDWSEESNADNGVQTQPPSLRRLPEDGDEDTPVRAFGASDKDAFPAAPSQPEPKRELRRGWSAGPGSEVTTAMGESMTSADEETQAANPSRFAGHPALAFRKLRHQGRPPSS